ncbi:MAG: rRNA adenine N-6-methyltransferase family protein [Candidatus Hodgkinia cicadicola]
MALTKRKWSQVFVDSNWICGKLVSAIGCNAMLSKVVCELGAGAGAVSVWFLRHNVVKLIVIEIDTQFIFAWLEFLKLYPGKLDLIFRDGMVINYGLLVFGTKLDLLAGSLPYGIATRLLTLLSYVNLPMLVIAQKEVYYKIGSNYSSLSLVFSNYVVRKLFDVAPFRFSPKPSVNSVCLLIIPMRKLKSGLDNRKLINTLHRFNSLHDGKS